MIIFISLIAGGGLALAQSEGDKAKIKILHAKVAYPGRDTLPTKLVGDVKLQHNDMIMTCDSLYQYDHINFIKAFGNVHMVQNDTLNMWGDYATYDGNSQMAKVRNNVKLDDNSITLTTNFLDYDAANKIGYYFNTGKIFDDVNTLESDYGYYYMPIKQMFFKDSVVVNSPEYVMNSDTMKYHTETKVINILGPTTIVGENRTLYSEDGWYNSLSAHAELYKNNRISFNTYSGKADTIVADSATNMIIMRNNLSLLDSVNNVLVEGNYGEMQKETNYAFVTKRALLTMIGNPDSLFLHADTLTLKKEIRDSVETNIVDAFYKVRMFNRDLQAVCDSMSFTTKDSLIYLYKDPVVWASGNQLTAEIIDLKLKDGMANQFHMQNNSLIVNPMDPKLIKLLDSTMFNQIKGRTVTGYLRNNELYQVFVDGSGETIYYPDDQGYPFALTKVLSSQIRIELENRQIQTITFLQKPEGTMNPLFMVTEDMKYLGGFKWRESERPESKADLFTESSQNTEQQTEEEVSDTKETE
ncbi:MAG: organic solvent tolerance protein OstA [Marinifilaceae bacterium]|nr:organic solvent tolerance protein OstA [Marinifilaceae bacterium]